MKFVLECEPRFDYGREEHELQPVDQGVVFRSKALHLSLHSTMELERRGSDVRATWTARVGEVGGVVLESSAKGRPRKLAPQEVLAMFNQTVRFRRDWLARSTYQGRW